MGLSLAPLITSLLLPATVAAAHAPLGGPGECLPGEPLAAAVAAVFGAATTPQELQAADLLPLSPADLQRLFDAAPAPALAALLGIDAVQVDLAPGPGFGTPFGSKAFRPEALTAGECCAGLWLDGPGGDLPFKAYAARSYFDECAVLQLSYDLAPNDPSARRRKDELRALNDELLLGIALDADVLDDDGLPLDGPAELERFFSVDVGGAGAWQDSATLGWPWSGSAPVGGAPPAGWTPAFTVDPLAWPFAHRVVQLRHGALHYADASPSGPQRGTVLFVHGNPTWGFLWRHAMSDLLADGWRVVAPDHFGFGLSDKPLASDFPQAPSDHADVLEDFVHALDLQELTLVVHDWGTSIGLATAGRLPSRVERIVVTNGWSWNVSPSSPGPFHKMIDWSLGNAADPAAFLDTGALPFSAGLGLAAHSGAPGSPEYLAALEAYWGPFLDTGTGLPLSTAAIEPTWVFAVEILTDRDFLTATERGLASLAEKPLATRFGTLDTFYGELVCDQAPEPACTPLGLTCVDVGGKDLCVDGAGVPALPVVERFEDLWNPQALAGRRTHPDGHFLPEKRGPEIADDVRYLAYFAGTGCGQGGAWPRLSSTPFELGQAVTLAVDGAEPMSPVVLFGSLAPPQSIALSDECALHLDLASLFVAGLLAADPDGAASASGSAPSNPALVGTALHFQAFAAAATGALGGIDLTNGLRLVLE